MTIPEPMPVAGWPNGEKPSVETPFAVMVTTDFWASAITSVRSRFWTVVALVVLAAPMVGMTPAAPGTSCVIAATVPPAASVALRTAAARIVPMPLVRAREPAVAAVMGAAGIAVAGSTGVQPRGVGSGVPRGAQVGISDDVAGGVVPGAGGGVGGVGLTKIGRPVSAPLSGRSLKVIVDLA